MKQFLCIVLSVLICGFVFTSCDDYVNRRSLYGNWYYSSDTVNLVFAFSMNGQFDYEKQIIDEGRWMDIKHFGDYTCTDSTFVLQCTQDYYDCSKLCEIMVFSYTIAGDQMWVIDEQGNQYTMSK